jgi:hypothetical protein
VNRLKSRAMDGSRGRKFVIHSHRAVQPGSTKYRDSCASSNFISRHHDHVQVVTYPSTYRGSFYGEMLNTHSFNLAEKRWRRMLHIQDERRLILNDTRPRRETRGQVT